LRSLAIGLGVLSSAAAAQTVEDLKRELAAKNADIVRLKNRVQLLQRTRLLSGRLLGRLRPAWT
jgi:hypothetical protein